MSGLLYREDMDEVRTRLTDWWNGGDLGRPALQVSAKRERPLEDIPELPVPEGCQCPGYTTMDFDFRVNQGIRGHINSHYLAEAVPTASPDLAPNCLALFLGCEGVEAAGSVWCEPCFESPEEARFEVDPDNFYWDFCLRLAREQLRLGKGKFLVQFPDLIEGLDTLAAMRNNERLLFDLIERPQWVHDCLRLITDRYFYYYDILYNMFRDEVGGSRYWAWAPGRMVKLQCDFSAMISPQMFGEFMVPVLTEMCDRIAYSMYHWDGPGALLHHDHLLSVPGLDMLQWTPGAGAPPTFDSVWWPYYHKSFEAGKKVLIGVDTLDTLVAIKAEFGESFKMFLINMEVASPAEAEEALKAAQV